MKYLLTLIILFTNNIIYSQEVSINKVVSNDDFILKYDNENFTISKTGIVSFKKFTYKLLDYENHRDYDAGHYIGFVYKNFLVADMTIDTGIGGMRYTVFADYLNNKIIFYKDIGDKPRDLDSIVGIKNKIIFLYPTQAICYNISTNKFIWDTIWNKPDDTGTASIGRLLKYFDATKKNIVIKLRNNNEIVLDYETGAYRMRNKTDSPEEKSPRKEQANEETPKESENKSRWWEWFKNL